jgi:hypothetical protein
VYSAIQKSIYILSEKEPDKIPILKEFLSRISQRDYQDVDEMIDDFIGFLDIFFIDQIADQRKFLQYTEDHHPCISPYARDRNFENVGY